MDSMDDIRERIEALERQTEQLQHETQALKAPTHTIERRLRWWRGMACGLGLLDPRHGARDARPITPSRPGFALGES